MGQAGGAACRLCLCGSPRRGPDRPWARHVGNDRIGAAKAQAEAARIGPVVDGFAAVRIIVVPSGCRFMVFHINRNNGLGITWALADGTNGFGFFFQPHVETGPTVQMSTERHNWILDGLQANGTGKAGIGVGGLL